MLIVLALLTVGDLDNLLLLAIHCDVLLQLRHGLRLLVLADVLLDLKLVLTTDFALRVDLCWLIARSLSMLGGNAAELGG